MHIHDKASEMPTTCDNSLLDEEGLKSFLEVAGEENKYAHDYVDPDMMGEEGDIGEVWICRKCGHGYKAGNEDGEPNTLIG